jgi:hypothetical protein
MRMRQQLPSFGCGLWAAVLITIPSWASASPAAVDVTHLLISVGAPATAYGLAMLTVYRKGQQ